MSAPLKYKEIITVLEDLETAARNGSPVKDALRMLAETSGTNASSIETMCRNYARRGSLADMFEGILPGHLIESIAEGEMAGTLISALGKARRVLQVRRNVFARIPAA